MSKFLHTLTSPSPWNQSCAYTNSISSIQQHYPIMTILIGMMQPCQGVSGTVNGRWHNCDREDHRQVQTYRCCHGIVDNPWDHGHTSPLGLLPTSSKSRSQRQRSISLWSSPQVVSYSLRSCTTASWLSCPHNNISSNWSRRYISTTKTASPTVMWRLKTSFSTMIAT